MKMLRTAFVAALSSIAAPSAAQTANWQFPAVEGYGPVTPVPGATARLEGETPYRVVFNITAGMPGDGRVSPDLAGVARFVNLLALSGMDPRQADLVAVVHGAATSAAVNDRAYLLRWGTPNPNAGLIEQLEENGVEVVVCGQAVAGSGFPFEAVLEPVEISISAMTEIARLQQQGYALMP